MTESVRPPARRRAPAGVGRLARLVLGMGVGLIATVRPGAAQVVRPGTSLSLLQADAVRDEMVYVYQVTLPGGGRVPAGRVQLDVASPKAPWQPSIRGIRGAFLFDALRTRYADATVGHAPLFIGTPEGWSGSIYLDGQLMWMWDETPLGRVEPGGSLGGFVLRSPALPALRAWRVSPVLPLPDPDDPSAVLDPTVVITTGYVLGPGWSPTEANAAYLGAQVALGCQLGLSRACPALQRRAAAVRAAESARDVAGYQRELSAFRADVGADTRMHPWARLVWTRTAEALASHALPPAPSPGTPGGA